MSEGKVEVEGETLTLEPGREFQLKTAVRFLSELTGAEDEHRLIGKVKDLEQITELGGEHCADSVILGELAYEVVEGFVGEPIEAAATETSESTASAANSAGAGDDSVTSGTSLEDAMGAAVGNNDSEGEIDMLARFFLNSTSNK
jgi:hypothetical protein